MTFRVDVSTGVADFIRGSCSLPSVQFKDGDWKLAGATISSRSSTARVTLKGGIQPQLTLSGMDIDSTAIDYGSGFIKVTPTSLLKVESVVGNVVADKSAVSIENVKIGGADVPAAKIQIGPARFAASGTGSAHINSLSNETVDAKFSWNAVQLPGLDGVAPVHISSLVLNATGPAAAPTLKGDAILSSIAMAALGVSAGAIPLHFSEDAGPNGDFSLPFNIAVPTPLEGSATIGDATGQNIKVKGTLSSLALKGAVTVSAGDVGLLIDPNGMHIGASASASVSKLVLGSPITFVGASFCCRRRMG